MKRLLILGSVALALVLSGCASIKSELAKLPPASAQSATFELGGKFTSTTVVATNYINDGQTIKADSIVVDHSDPWVTKLHWEGKGVTLTINPSAVPTAEPTPPAAKPSTP